MRGMIEMTYDGRLDIRWWERRGSVRDKGIVQVLQLLYDARLVIVWFEGASFDQRLVLLHRRRSSLKGV